MPACWGGLAQSRTFPPGLLVPQISTQRKVNIYNILQEIIQQEGELEEQCVHRLVAIASKEMRELPEVVEPGTGSALCPASPGAELLVGTACDARGPCPVTSWGKNRLSPGGPQGLEEAWGGGC